MENSSIELVTSDMSLESEETKKVIDVDILAEFDKYSYNESNKLDGVQSATKIWPLQQTKSLLTFIMNQTSKYKSEWNNSSQLFYIATSHVNEVHGSSFKKIQIIKKFRSEMSRFKFYNEKTKKGKLSLKPKFYAILRKIKQNIMDIRNEDFRIPGRDASLLVSSVKDENISTVIPKRRHKIRIYHSSSCQSGNLPTCSTNAGTRVNAKDKSMFRNIGVNTDESYIAIQSNKRRYDELFASIPPNILDEFSQEVPHDFSSTKRKTTYQQNINMHLKQQSEKTQKILETFTDFMKLYTISMQNINDTLQKLKHRLDSEND